MRTILFNAMGVMLMLAGMELNDSGYFIASGLFFICMNLSRFFDEMLPTQSRLLRELLKKHKEEDKNA